MRRAVVLLMRLLPVRATIAYREATVKKKRIKIQPGTAPLAPVLGSSVSECSHSFHKAMMLFAYEGSVKKDTRYQFVIRAHEITNPYTLRERGRPYKLKNTPFSYPALYTCNVSYYSSDSRHLTTWTSDNRLHRLLAAWNVVPSASYAFGCVGD